MTIAIFRLITLLWIAGVVLVVRGYGASLTDSLLIGALFVLYGIFCRVDDIADKLDGK